MEVSTVKERLTTSEVVPTPALLREQFPLSLEAQANIARSRQSIQQIMQAPQPDKLIVMTGFCSLDELELQCDEANTIPAAVVYAQKMADFIHDNPFITDNLEVILRCPPAKPRSEFGWRGLEHSNPTRAFELMTAFANIGLPLAIECMNDRQLQYYGDMLSLGWVGARNIEDTELRPAFGARPELPVLLKNGTDGTLHSALQARNVIMDPERKMDLHERGILFTDYNSGQLRRHSQLPGNPHVGVIHRGGSTITNPEEYAQSLFTFAASAREHDFGLIADASHGGATAHGGKTVAGERACLEHLADLLTTGFDGLQGVMFESHLAEGAEKGLAGTSQTDPCVGFDEMCHNLARFAQIQAKQRG